MVALDERLTQALYMAKPCETCADIGADHGRLSAALLDSGRAKRVLVSDISDKSLDKARRTLCALGLDARAVFAVADGLAALDALGETRAQCVFILGMGGETLRRILLEGGYRLGGAELILGAQTDLSLVRQALCQIDYRVRRESVVTEGRYSYVLMGCGPMEPGEPAYGEKELLLGPALLKEPPPQWRPMLERRRRHLLHSIAAMEQARADKCKERIPPAKRELGYVEEVLKQSF